MVGEGRFFFDRQKSQVLDVDIGSNNAWLFTSCSVRNIYKAAERAEAIAKTMIPDVNKFNFVTYNAPTNNNCTIGTVVCVFAFSCYIFSVSVV